MNKKLLVGIAIVLVVLAMCAGFGYLWWAACDDPARTWYWVIVFACGPVSGIGRTPRPTWDGTLRPEYHSPATVNFERTQTAEAPQPPSRTPEHNMATALFELTLTAEAP